MEDSARNSTLKILLPVAALLVVVLLGVLAYGYFGRQRLPPPAELESTALSTSAPPEQRVQAALQLSQHGAAGQTQMRRLLVESKDPDVRAAAVQGLTERGDWNDMPQIMKALDDPSPWVRARAARGVLRAMGTNFEFNANASPQVRAETIKKIQRQYEWQENYRTTHHDGPN